MTFKQLPAIHGFQHSYLAPIYNIDQRKWISNINFADTQGQSVQIHHTGHDHWVTSLQTCTNEIYVLDSMFKKLTTSLEIQLSQLYAHGKKVTG